MLSRILILTLPTLVFVSNIFVANGMAEITFTLAPIFLLFASILASKGQRVAKGKYELYIYLILQVYLFVSGFFVIYDTQNDGIASKNLILNIINFAPCVWFLFTKDFTINNYHQNIQLFTKGVIFVSAVYITIVIPILILEGERSWAYVSMHILPNRNDISIFFLVGLSGLLFIESNYSQSKWLIYVLITVTALLLTFSRSSYLCLVIVLIYYFYNMKNRAGYIGFIVCIASVAILFMFVGNNPVVDRLMYTFESGTQGNYDDSTTLRITIWEYAKDHFLDNPIFGIGFQRSPFWHTDLNSIYGEKVLFGHNYFISQLYQLGVVGVLLTMLIFHSFLISIKRVSFTEQKFSFAVLAIFLSASMFGEPLYGYSKYIFMIIYCSLISVNVENYNER